LISQIITAPSNCDGGAQGNTLDAEPLSSGSGPGGATASGSFGLSSFQISAAENCQKRLICTNNCTACSAQVFFDCGAKTNIFAISDFAVAEEYSEQTLSEATLLEEADDETLGGPLSGSGQGSGGGSFFGIPMPNLPVMQVNEYPILTSSYDKYCNQPKRTSVTNTINTMITNAEFPDLDVSYPYYETSMRTARMNNLLSVPENVLFMFNDANPMVNMNYLNTIYNIQRTVTNSQDQQLRTILTNFADSISRLCERSELSTSTPIQYLNFLWSNYTSVACPAIPANTRVSALAQTVLMAIVNIWTQSCDCSSFIKSADPTGWKQGTYASQLQFATGQCSRLCTQSIPVGKIGIGKITPIAPIFKQPAPVFQAPKIEQKQAPKIGELKAPRFKPVTPTVPKSNR